MDKQHKWQSVGWNTPFWELVRYFCSLRGKEQISLLEELATESEGIGKWKAILGLTPQVAKQLKTYILDRRIRLAEAMSKLRSESEAQKFCKSLGVNWATTATKSQDHHQSSKSLIAAVAAITDKITKHHGLEFNSNPQRRCTWIVGELLHVSARNLDGAIENLQNPFAVWEIKEYWGKTNGGSKMSDAVYECQLVGREIREFEKKSGISIGHFVFLDGKDQWMSRKSDLGRFLDLESQGLIDRLFVGVDVESEWRKVLSQIILKRAETLT